MFSPRNQSKSTLLSGSPKFTKSFIFEAAIYWAEEGHRVLYITQNPLESLPSIYHDRNNLSPAAFKLMRFMYLPSYETLVEQLVDLHTFAILPSVLLIDDLDAYIDDPIVKKNPVDVHIARLCAFIQDSTNACSRILKTPVHFCLSISMENLDNLPYTISFDNLWNLRIIGQADENNEMLELYRQGDDETDAARKFFTYRNLTDGTLLLKQIYEKFISST